MAVHSENYTKNVWKMVKMPSRSTNPIGIGKLKLAQKQQNGQRRAESGLALKWWGTEGWQILEIHGYPKSQTNHSSRISEIVTETDPQGYPKPKSTATRNPKTWISEIPKLTPKDYPKL